MMISITDELLAIDEALIEEICWNDSNKVKVSKSRIRRIVSRHTKEKESYKRRSIRKLRIAVACCLVLGMAIPVYAVVSGILQKSAPVDENNKSYVGTEIQDQYYIIYKNGEYIDSDGKRIDITQPLDDSLLKKNRIVSEIQQPNFIPSSIVEIEQISAGKNSSNYPEMILVNGSLCILTGEDGSGWDLKQGDSITYSFKKKPSSVVDNQNLIVGVIKDGVLLEGSGFRSLENEFVFKADKEGVYYIYLISGSSDYLTLDESELIVER